MIKLIIFDWDDVFTLGATEGYVACYQKAIHEVGVRRDPETERAIVLKKWGRKAEDVLAELLQDSSKLSEAITLYERTLLTPVFSDRLSFVTGAQEALQRLSGSYTLAIATGSNPRLLRGRIMPMFHVPDVFAQIVSIYDNPDPLKAKPHPYMLEQIMQTQKVDCSNTLFVGDAPNDIRMAQNAGVASVAVLTGHLNREQAEKASADYIIGDVTHLENLLKKISP